MAEKSVEFSLSVGFDRIVHSFVPFFGWKFVCCQVLFCVFVPIVRGCCYGFYLNGHSKFEAAIQLHSNCSEQIEIATGNCYLGVFYFASFE